MKRLVMIAAAAAAFGGMAEIPRPEYPRPQFERTEWVNLNGRWTCSLDCQESGEERGLASSRGFETAITVPFCPESKLSGVGYVDFIPAMWYHRKVSVPAGWAGRRSSRSRAIDSAARVTASRGCSAPEASPFSTPAAPAHAASARA